MRTTIIKFNTKVISTDGRFVQEIEGSFNRSKATVTDQNFDKQKIRSFKKNKSYINDQDIRS